jgi:hypothetical protein
MCSTEPVGEGKLEHEIDQDIIEITNTFKHKQIKS